MRKINTPRNFLTFQRRSKKAATLLSRSKQYRHAVRMRCQSLVVAGIGFCLFANLGCQSLHPFAQKTHQGIVSARTWASSGIDAFQNGKLDQAKGLFSRAAEQNPNDVSVRVNLARTLRQSGEIQQAIIQMQQAVDLSDTDPRLLVELGEMYLDAGQWIPARRQVELALKADRRNATAWFLSGKTQKAKGDYQNALTDFQRALGLMPDQVDVQLQIVDTYQKMGQPRRALSAVEHCLSKHPADEQPELAIIAKSVALMDLQQMTPAIEILQAASQKSKASSEVFVRLGQAQLLAGQVSQARLTLGRGKQNFPHLTVFDQLIGDLQSAGRRVASIENRNMK